MTRRLLAIPIAVIVLGVAFLAWMPYHLARWAAQPLPVTAPVEFVVVVGASLSDVADTLSDSAGVDALQFSLRARQRDLQGLLRHGEYRIALGETADGLLDRLTGGDVLQHRVRLPEGATVGQVLALLRADERLEFDLHGAGATDLLVRLDKPAGHAEGRFFPDTYLFERGDPASSVLLRAHAEMAEVLAAAWAGRDPETGYATPYEALILASMVEKETGSSADRAQVAGVFVRRLERRMRLQSDPTVIYGLGNAFNGDLTRAHLKADGPYNTYRIAGLPPTPIALPGRAAIEAAMHPASGDALYFVARGDGSSQFSRTLAEHNAAVRRYQLGGAARD